MAIPYYFIRFQMSLKLNHGPMRATIITRSIQKSQNLEFLLLQQKKLSHKQIAHKGSPNLIQMGKGQFISCADSTNYNHG